MPVKDIYPTRRLSTSVNLSLDLDRISSHFVGQSQRSNLIHNDTIKEGDERVPLLYKPDGLGNFVYSTIDTMTLSLVPHIQIRDQEHPGISWLSVAFGIANAAIGVGVLNYPAAYHRIGGIEIATLVQLALVTVLFISMSILIFCSDLNGSNSYHEILSNICGKKAEILVAGDIFLGTFGICVAYLIVIGDQYDRILASLVGDDFCHSWFLNRKFTIAATAIFISPLCFMKKLDFLRHTGPLGIISMAYVVFLTIYEHFALTDVVPGEIRTRPESFTAMFGIIPVMCFGYQCNEVIIPIYASMKNRNPRNFYKAASLAYGVLIFLYGAVGYFGYKTFGSKVYPDIITMFNARDPLVMIGITALILKMAVTYPQMCFVGRGAFEGIFAYFSGKPIHELEKTEKCRRNTISCTWFIGSLLLALFAPDIGVVIETLGSLAAVNIFIFPSMCLILLAHRDRYEFSRFTKFIFYTIGIIFIVIGVVVLSLVLNQVYIDISGTNSEPLVPLCRA